MSAVADDLEEVANVYMPTNNRQGVQIADRLDVQYESMGTQTGELVRIHLITYKFTSPITKYIYINVHVRISCLND